ncbi:hypothetical protein QI297_00460 [Staphylococcus saprophyticus]|nr:hypothetical protein [Staphylococcus saprophyticus]
MVNTVKDYEKLSEQYNKMLEERDTLIDDLKTLRKLSAALKASENSLWLSSREFECERDELEAKVSRLEQEKEIFHRKLMAQLEVNTELKMGNKDKHAILSEISQHIGNKPSSSTYKYFRAKLDNLNIMVDK